MLDRLSQLAWAQFWQITLLILVVGIVARLVSRRWPHVAWTLWVIVIVKCVTPPVWYSPSGFFCWSATKPILPHVEYELPADVFGNSTKQSDKAKSKTTSASNSQHAGQDQSEQSNALTKAQTGSTSTTVIASSAPSIRVHWATVLVVIWCIGTVLIALVVLRRWQLIYYQVKNSTCPVDPKLQQQLDRLRDRLGISRSFRLIITEQNYGPCVLGFVRPTMILPQKLVCDADRKTLESILAHELIHVRRGDTLLDLLQMIAQVFWWFHPMVWWANRQVNRLSEHCCDDETVVGLSCQPISYARGLLRVLELRNDIKPVVAISGMRAVEVTRQRLESLMSRKSRLIAKAPAICWLLAICGGLFFLPGAFENISPFGKEEKNETRPSPLIAAANAFSKQDWDKAAEEYEKVVVNNPQNGLAWFRLGYALHISGKYEEAIVAHAEAANFPKAKHIALYNWACALCLLDRHDEALQKLEESVKAGFQDHQLLKTDTDWKALWENKRFVAIWDELETKVKTDVYRQFDFWIGNWVVEDANGNRLGSSTVTAETKGYIINEEWTSATGGKGKSMNFYDPDEKAWKQTWVDGAGNVSKFTGIFKDGSMLFKGKSTKKDGSTELVKMKFTPLNDGRVQQSILKSTDQGKSWKSFFNGYYKKLEK